MNAQSQQGLREDHEAGEHRGDPIAGCRLCVAPDTRTTAELRDALKTAEIRLEQAMKRMGGTAEPVPWSDVARKTDAWERVLIMFLAEIGARVDEVSVRTDDEPEHAARRERYVAALTDALERAQVQVQLEAAEKTLADVQRMELTQGGAPLPRRPRLV